MVQEACAALIDAPVTVMVPEPAAAATAPAAVTVGAPPQLSVTLGAAAITRPAGSVSLNVRPLRAGAPAGFAIVKLSVAACPTPIVTGANALVRDASGCTVRPLAVTALVTRASALMLPAAFVYGPPTTLDVTSTVTTHEATVAFIAAAVTVTTPPPAGAETNAGLAASAPPAGQLDCTLGAAATSTLAGSVSVKLMPDCAGLPAPFVIVKVSVEVPPWLIVAGAKALLSEACENGTASCRATVEISPAAVSFNETLVEALALALATPTETAHAVAPVIDTDPLPAAAVTAPAPDGQVVVTLGAAATTTFAGSVSVKLMPLCAGLPAPFVSVKVSVEVPPTSITVGAKPLLSEACTTVSTWLVTPLVSTPPTVMLPAPFV